MSWRDRTGCDVEEVLAAQYQTGTVAEDGFVNLIWPLLMVSFGPTLKACDLSFRVGLGGRSP
jgi:hypothetical protein